MAHFLCSTVYSVRLITSPFTEPNHNHSSLLEYLCNDRQYVESDLRGEICYVRDLSNTHRHKETNRSIFTYIYISAPT